MSEPRTAAGRDLIANRAPREIVPDEDGRISVLDAVIEGVRRALREQPRFEVHVWRPSDLSDPIETSVIGRTLR